MRPTVRRRWYLAASIAAAIGISDSPAIACQPGPYTTYLPACSVPAAALEEEVVVVKTSDMSRRVSSVAVGDNADIRFGVVDVDVKPGSRPIYLVLSSYYPVIWRLNGAIESVSRVVAFGSTKNGADVVGIVGAPRDKIVFPAPDTAVYAQGESFNFKRQPSMCDWVAKACVPESFLFHYPVSASDPRAVIVRRLRPLLSAQGAAIIGQRSDGDTADFKTVEAGPLPPASLETPKFVERIGENAETRVSIRDDRGEQKDQLVMLAPEDVVSPRRAAPYDVAPGAAGLRQLVETGVLFEDGSENFKAAFATWNETRSTPYRSRFDPGFLFPNPHITHLIARPLDRLPALEFGRFLLADGAPIPKHAANSYKAYCFAYVGGAQAGEEDCNPTAQLSNAAVSGANGDSLDIQKARIDDLRWFEEASPEDRARVRSEPVNQFATKDVITSRRKYLHGAGPTCRLMEVSQGVFSAALTIYAGRSEPTSARERPRIRASAGDRLDVVVRRPGNVLLYLNSEVGARWHVSAGKDTRIVGILLRDSHGSVVEKPDGVIVREIGDILSFPTRAGVDCGAYWPPQKGQLG